LELVRKMREQSINVIQVSQVLPDYKNNEEKYFLYRDSHPSAFANQQLAQYLASTLETN